MALKTCTVIIQDLNQTEHTLDVMAETLYEAVAQGLAALRADDWAGEIGRGLTTASIKVRHPEVTHVVKIQDFENWLKRGCNSLSPVCFVTQVLSTLTVTPGRHRLQRPMLAGLSGSLIRTNAFP